MNELTERVSKAEQQTEKEKVQLRLLMETHENLKAELQNTKKTLSQVTEERDEARRIIIQRNEGTVQKRIRLSER